MRRQQNVKTYFVFNNFFSPPKVVPLMR